MIESVTKALKAGSDNIKRIKISDDIEMKLPREVISKKSKALIKKTEELLLEQMEKLRKQKAVPGKYIELSKYHKKEAATVTVRPLYNSVSFEDSILVEIKKPNSTELINISRRNPEKFRYEKMVPTQNGHATTNSYDSKRQSNETMETKVDNLIQEYLQIFFPQTKLNRYIIHSDLM